MTRVSVPSVAVCFALAACSSSESDTIADGTGGTGGEATPMTNGGAAPSDGGGPSDGGSTGSGPVVPDCSEEPTPAPSAAWQNVTGNLANMPSECGNLTLVVATPCS